MNHQHIVRSITSSFPTEWHNATKFGISHVLVGITLASVSGISRICRIAAFSGDGLVKALLRLDKAINENAISATLRNLGQSGARKLQMFLLSRNARWVRESGLESITLDADSTVKSVCGNQEGAKSYHPLLVFVSEMKLLYHTWFRSGSAYTSNGIVEFLKEVQSSLPRNIRKVFFRADSGFFSVKLFDLLESFSWDYLVKVKLKNLEDLLKAQDWTDVEEAKDVAICEFIYQAGSWQQTRILKAMCTVKEYVEVSYLGENKTVPVYQYVCYGRKYTDR
jgi:hypothetical protein